MHSRYQKRLLLQSRAVFMIGSHAGEGRLLNINGTGGLIESPVHVYRGDYVPLKLFLPGLPSPLVVTLAAVRWNHGNQFGVEFIQLPQKEQQVMRQFLAQYPDLSTRRRRRHYSSDPGGQNWHLDTYRLTA